MTQFQVQLPVLHAGQLDALNVINSYRFTAGRCGRRYGKTELGKTWAADGALKAEPVGWFAPDYKRLSESYNDLSELLKPVIRNSSKTEGMMRLLNGGRIEFWTLEDEHAGRSRRYKRVVIDEGAFTKPNMLDIWNKAIKPTLLDFSGKAAVLSNTNGIDPNNFMWQVCHMPELGFAQFNAPTAANPHLPAEEVAKLQAENLPLVYQQEYLAEFVDWSGEAFFSRDKLLVEGMPVEGLAICDGVFAVIDTATKTGKENDGTAVTYYAVCKSIGRGPPLYILDWDTVQIEGSLLEAWLPTVFKRLEELAAQFRARLGSLGAWIEDKASGMVLLQQAARRGWKAHPIDSKLTAMGKSERAISVSGYVYRGLVKMMRHAFDKVTAYKGVTRNHLLGQVVGFRVGNKDKVDDDLLDTFTYGIAVALGNAEGF